MNPHTFSRREFPTLFRHSNIFDISDKNGYFQIRSILGVDDALKSPRDCSNSERELLELTTGFFNYGIYGIYGREEFFREWFYSKKTVPYVSYVP
jgi:hypothetical protein